MNLQQDYQNILKDIVLKRHKREDALPDDKKTNEFDPKIRFDEDLTASIRLFEKGYSLDDVISVLKKFSPMLINLALKLASN